MKTGRNAPCPCGSGKKYKKCCLSKQETVPAKDVHYRRLMKVHDKLIDRLMKLSRQVFGELGTLTAVSQFWGWPESEEEELMPTDERMELVAPLFWPWFLFCWHYDPADFEDPVERGWPEKMTVAECYLRQRGKGIDPLEARLIGASGRQPQTFYEVVAVDAGRSLDLEDVLTGSRVTVLERTGSEFVHPHDIVFGRATMVDGVGMLIGLGPTLIPPAYKPELINLRNWLREEAKTVTDEILGMWDVEIRLAYLQMVEQLHQPPQLQNSQGDAFEFHKLIFEIDSAAEALDKLAPLCPLESPEALLQMADLDDEGCVLAVEFPWGADHGRGELSNTVLGHIVIDGTRLTIEVNSARRAATIREEVERLMGSAARFRMDEIQDVDAMMEQAGQRPASARFPGESAELMNNPQVQAALAEMMEAHWEGWVDEALPALNGQTPREAARSEEGKEKLEALLVDMERRSDQDDSLDSLNRAGVLRVRQQLGLEI